MELHQDDSSPDLRHIPWRLRDVVVALSILLAYRILATLLNVEWLKSIPAWLVLGLGVLAPMLFLLCYPYLIARRRGWLGVAWPRPRKVLLEAGLSGILVCGVLLLTMSVGYLVQRYSPDTSITPPIWQEAARTSRVVVLGFVLIISFTLAPVCEEVFFRGFLHNALCARMPFAAAVAVQSLLFGFAHTFGVLHALIAALLGGVLTLIYEWRKTLITPILVHAGNNLLVALGVVAMMLMHANSPVLGVSGHDHPDGCQIDRIAPESAAEKAQLALGDVITHIDDQPIQGMRHLAEVVSSYEIGDEVAVYFLRDGQSYMVSATLQQRP